MTRISATHVGTPIENRRIRFKSGKKTGICNKNGRNTHVGHIFASTEIKSEIEIARERIQAIY